MPGSFGNNGNEDGAVASTQSSAKSGVFGFNDATTQPPPGVPGGNGVFGFSKVPHASGVFGANDDTDGTGVTGNSVNGTGVQGSAHSSAKSGVFGLNDATSAPPPGVPGGNGVFGFSKAPNASGVFGANDVGFGVAGFSSGNVGVLGRGRIAGRFEGPAEITGRLTLQGQDVEAQITQLQNQQGQTQGPISQLNDKIGTIRSVLLILIPALQLAGFAIPPQVETLLQRL